MNKIVVSEGADAPWALPFGRGGVIVRGTCFEKMLIFAVCI